MGLLSNTFGKAKQAATLGLAAAAFTMPFNTWAYTSSDPQTLASRAARDLANPRVTAGMYMGKDAKYSKGKALTPKMWEDKLIEMMGVGSVAHVQYIEGLETSKIVIYATAQDQNGKSSPEVFGPSVLNRGALEKLIEEAQEQRQFMIIKIAGLDDIYASLDRR